MTQQVDAVVFDVGGVLLDWNPRHLYDTLIPDPDEREWFLTEVCSPEWNAAQDAGRDWETAVAELCARFPSWASHIEAYSTRWAEMVAGPLEQTVAVLAELRARGVPTYALTNFSAQKWEVALERWDFLRGFAGTVVSGREGVVKPDPKIYRLLVERFNLEPARTFFTDDVAANVEGARATGIRAELFVDAGVLRSQLSALGVLPA